MRGVEHTSIWAQTSFSCVPGIFTAYLVGLEPLHGDLPKDGRLGEIHVPESTLTDTGTKLHLRLHVPPKSMSLSDLDGAKYHTGQTDLQCT